MFRAENVMLQGVHDNQSLGISRSSGNSTPIVGDTHHAAVQQGKNGVALVRDDGDNSGCWLGGLASNDVCLDIMRILEK